MQLCSFVPIGLPRSVVYIPNYSSVNSILSIREKTIQSGIFQLARSGARSRKNQTQTGVWLCLTCLFVYWAFSKWCFLCELHTCAWFCEKGFTWHYLEFEGIWGSSLIVLSIGNNFLVINVVHRWWLAMDSKTCSPSSDM